MKGYRFYLEYPTAKEKRRGKHSGNVFALYTGEGIESAETQFMLRYCPHGVGGIYSTPNSPVSGTGVSMGFLRDMCKRISEEKARLIHPALFDYLEQGD